LVSIVLLGGVFVKTEVICFILSGCSSVNLRRDNINPSTENTELPILGNANSKVESFLNVKIYLLPSGVTCNLG
jgi:hypothetical protein